jgi:hypothetical protein
MVNASNSLYQKTPRVSLELEVQLEAPNRHSLELLLGSFASSWAIVYQLYYEVEELKH